MITYIIGQTPRLSTIGYLYTNILSEAFNRPLTHISFISQAQSVKEYAADIGPFNHTVQTLVDNKIDCTIVHNGLYAALYQGLMYNWHNNKIPFIFYNLTSKRDTFPPYYSPPQHDYFELINYDLDENPNYCEKGHAGLLILKTVSLCTTLTEEICKKISDITNSL